MRRRIARFVKKWRTEWAVVTVIIYLGAVPVTVVIFPANSLWLALLVTFGGLTDSLNSLADRLGDDEEDKDSVKEAGGV